MGTLERWREIAKDLGSRAETPGGIIRWYAGLAPWTQERVRTLIRARVCPMNRLTRRQWDESVKTRQADPDAKRAHKNRKFRPRYLRELRRIEAKATEYTSDLDGVLRWIDAKNNRLAILDEVARLRSIVYSRPISPITVNGPRYVSPTIDAETAARVGYPPTRRGLGWRVCHCAGPSHRFHADGETTWRGGRPKKYTRAVNVTYVQSVAVIVSPRTAEYVIHETRGQVILPVGYRWEYDNQTLRALRENSSDDWHCSATDLLDGSATIVQHIEEARQRREQHRARLVAEKAEVEGVWVCLADSVRAGNCLVGTRDFAAKHGLDTSRHYAAGEILDLANGDGQRVRLAITAARIRHRREMEAGCCNLLDHRS